VSNFARLRSQRPLHVQGDAGLPGWQGGGQEKNNRKNGGLRRRRGTRGCWPNGPSFIISKLSVRF
jgi:hypothetical protein